MFEIPIIPANKVPMPTNKMIDESALLNWSFSFKSEAALLINIPLGSVGSINFFCFKYFFN